MVMAINHDWPEAAAALIERGCDVNATSEDGDTALHFAGRWNHRETARVLLERGADRTIKNKDGKTAATYIERFTSATRLIYVARTAETEAYFLKVLHECGEAGVKYRSGSGSKKDGTTVLMQMAYYHDPARRPRPSSRGCDVNATNENGDTALHVIGKDATATAFVLLEKGADTTIENSDGRTAVDVARLNGHNDLATILSLAKYINLVAQHPKQYIAQGAFEHPLAARRRDARRSARRRGGGDFRRAQLARRLFNFPSASTGQG